MGYINLEQFNRILAHEIPLVNALQMRLTEYADFTLCAEAPLGPNINHKQTAFGGSLYSVAVLTGWAVVNIRLQEYQQALRETTQVVIYQSDMNYQHAVNGDFQARVTQSEKLRQDRFIKQLQRHGKASCQEHIEIWQQNQCKAVLRARYVAVIPG